MNTYSGSVRFVQTIFAAIAALALAFSPFVNVQFAGAASGAIWTTTGSCGDPQNVNHYEVGQTVYVNGSGFDANTSYTWEIKDPGANGAQIASGPVQSDANGNLCAEALFLEDEHLGGPYQAQLVGVSTKNDNFSVVEGTQSNGTLTIVKAIENSDVSATIFSYEVTGGSDTLIESGSFDEDGTVEVPLNLGDGPFTVVEPEADGDGYTTSYSGSCTDVELTSEGATCTITNTFESVVELCEDPDANNTGGPLPCTYDPELGSITIDKVITGEGANLDLDFSFGTWEENATSLSANDDPVTFSGLASSTYTITENNVNPPYSFVGVECSIEGEGISEFNSVQNGVGITLAEGEDVTCVFTNHFEEQEETATGTIVVIKEVTDGSNTATEFTFDPSWASSFNLAHGESESFTVDVGTYSISEVLPSGDWTLQNSQCDSAGGQSVDNDSASEINLEEGETVTCTFTNHESTDDGGGGNENQCATFESTQDVVAPNQDFTLSWALDGDITSVEVSPLAGTFGASDSEQTSITEDTNFVLSAFIDEEEQFTCDLNVTLSGGGGGGGSSSGSRNPDPEPEPEVLGEAIEVLPIGAPETGAGGTSPVVPQLPTLLAVLAGFRRVKNA